MGVVALDFAKAFEKENYNKIIFEKVSKKDVGQGVPNKKNFKILSRGNMSDEDNILYRVRQGKILACVLFMIMISDIEKEIKESIV